jgi:hypothetical protein
MALGQPESGMLPTGEMRWPLPSSYSAPLNDSDENHDYGNDQEHVNEPAQGGAGYKAEAPEQQKDNGDGHDHDFVFSMD